MSRRRGYTLIELLFATALALLIVSVVFRMLLSSSRMFVSGVAAVRGPEAAMLLMDRLEEDLNQVIQVPGDPRPPMLVSEEGDRVLFYRSSRDLSTPRVMVGVPARWELLEAKDGLIHPARDGDIFDEVVVNGWELRLYPPDIETDRPGWYLAITVRFPTGGLVRSEYVASRLLQLHQPSSNFLHYLNFGHEILPGSVQLVPPSADELDEGFRELQPPEGSPEAEPAPTDGSHT